MEGKFMIIILLALLGLIPAYIASNKGYSVPLWWIYGALLFIIVLPHSILAKPANQAIDVQNKNAGNKKCPSCAEWVRSEATICKHCNRPIPA